MLDIEVVELQRGSPGNVSGRHSASRFDNANVCEAGVVRRIDIHCSKADDDVLERGECAFRQVQRILVRASALLDDMEPLHVGVGATDQHMNRGWGCYKVAAGFADDDGLGLQLDWRTAHVIGCCEVTWADVQSRFEAFQIFERRCGVPVKQGSGLCFRRMRSTVCEMDSFKVFLGRA